MASVLDIALLAKGCVLEVYRLLRVVGVDGGSSRIEGKFGRCVSLSLSVRSLFIITFRVVIVNFAHRNFRPFIDEVPKLFRFHMFLEFKCRCGGGGGGCSSAVLY